MSWQDRMMPIIMLTSPNGDFFEAKWSGDERSFEKSVQRDKYPLIKGETGVDLGGGADGYDITIVFDGENCDVKAESFYRACEQSGTWWIQHPVHGRLELQLLSVRQPVDPVRSGGSVEVETKWFEPLDPVTLVTLRQMTAAIDSAAAAMTSYSVSIYSAKVKKTGWGDISAIIGVINLIAGIAGMIAERMASTAVSPPAVELAKTAKGKADADLSTEIDATKADTSAFDPGAIATACHTSIQSIALMSSDTSTTVSAMNDLVDGAAALLPTTTSTSALNRAMTLEVQLEAALVAACLSATIGKLQTRTQAVESSKALATLFAKITGILDGVMEQFEDEIRPDRRYYAQTETYQSALQMVSQTIDYLLRQAFDLAIEKTIMLDRDKTPLQICTEEYGSAGESKVDDFIEWNDLQGDDVMILGPGREVVVYVEAR